MTIDRDLQKLDPQPFQDTVDTAFFFPGAGRREVIDEIKTALNQSVPLILLTGEGGSGKTMVCRMVEKEMVPGVISVFLPQAINSYDEMVRIVQQQIGFNLEEEGQEINTAAILEKITTALAENNRRLVVFFDEAEKIYLATLERVRKLLDQVNEETIRFQFVFSARKQFQENLEQLSIVTFKDIEERHFTLRPVIGQETFAYLNHCMKIASGEAETSFSQDLLSKVSEKGTTFRRLNHFAAESIQSEHLDTSFLGLIDTVEINPDSRQEETADDQTLPPPGEKREVNLEFLSFRKILPGWIFLGGGVFATALLLFFLFHDDGDREPAEDGTSDVPIIELKKVVPVNPPAVTDISETEEPSSVEPLKPKEGDEASAQVKTGGEEDGGQKTEELTDTGTTAVSPESAAENEQPGTQESDELVDAGEAEELTDLPAEGEKTSIQKAVNPPETSTSETAEVVTEPLKSDRAAGIPEIAGELTGATSAEIAAAPAASEANKADQQKPEEYAAKAPSAEVSAQAGSEAATADQGEETADEQAEELTTNVMVEPLEETEAPFSPDTIKETKLPDRPRLPETIVIIGDEKKFKDSKEARGKTTVEKVVPEKTRDKDLTEKDVDALFLRRIAAGARWLVGGGSGKYTIQLMVLTSDEAEDSLKKMLRSAEFQSVANQLYVLRRTGPDPTVMVFYGEYPSLAAARNGRNNLPVFLRKHNPYAISVFGAVEKATTPQ